MELPPTTKCAIHGRRTLALNHALVEMNIFYIHTATALWPDRAVGGEFFQTEDDHVRRWFIGVG